ncbi:disease resistance protein RPM1-like [Mercurialis annua]|uniref:disease resistance protein RPM1-like n=1 Tax=Mercurialis annua TaxID=3986 RepID=UPI002160A3E8|nr:disease resistance protein RPM1-like [Mercurialis annua]
MAEIAVTGTLLLAETLLTFLNQKGGHENVHVQVKKLATWLGLMESYIRDEQENETREVAQDLVKQARDVAYDIEDILDEYMLLVSHEFHSHEITAYASKIIHYPGDTIALRNLSASIKIVESKIDQLSQGQTYQRACNSTPAAAAEAGSSSGLSQEGFANLVGDEIVGYEKQRRLLLDLVTGQDTRRVIIPVVGPGGSGKSMLVKNMYGSEKVQQLFDCLAWVHVAQPFRLDDVLQKILQQLCQRISLNELNHRKYLVVLDDIWRQDDLEKIIYALPYGIDGCRIIFTSQITASCGRSSNHVVELNGLPTTDAFNLFCKKAFVTGKCPDELIELSQNIVARCEGPPLAIAALGSLLSRKNQTQIEWMKLHESLSSEIISNSQLVVISKSLMRSFRHLSSTIKSCFLYFSIFPEDYSVKRGRLIRAWVAEGFVKKTPSRTAEEVAEDCLNELVERNLISISLWEIDGRVRSCRILNLVRGFIISKAEEYNFAKFLCQSDPVRPGEKIRRLSVHQDASATFALSRNLLHVRTSFLFKHRDITLSKIKQILDKFRLLRVLDLENAPLEEFPDEIVTLRLLRYLSLRNTNIRQIPKSIKKLVFLETLDLKQTLVTILPLEILKLRNLHNLLAYRYNVKNYVTYESVQGVEFPQGIGKLCALQKLSLVKINPHFETIQSLGNLIQLRKLGLTGLRREDGKQLCASILKMEKLSTLDLRSRTEEEYLDVDYMQYPPSCLQRLYLKGRLQKLPGWIPRLHSVVRIGLNWSKLNANENPVNALQALSCLAELRLVDCYNGDKFEFKANMFGKLKVLHIEQFDELNMIVVEKKAMPMLEKLTIGRCNKLKMLPLGISNLSHLQELLLYGMHTEFIAKLQKHAEDRRMVNHVKIIHSFTLQTNHEYWTLQNLS